MRSLGCKALEPKGRKPKRAYGFIDPGSKKGLKPNKKISPLWVIHVDIAMSPVWSAIHDTGHAGRSAVRGRVS
jgi:hypothetical protein